MSQNEPDLCRIVQMRNFELKHAVDSEFIKTESKPKRINKLARRKCIAVCTSTPRKSKTYFDRRRPLKPTPTPPSATSLHKNQQEGIERIEDSFVETPVTTHPVTLVAVTVGERKSRRQSRHFFARNNLNSCETVESSEGREMRRKSYNFKRRARPSINVHGNMFAHTRAPKHGLLRDLNRVNAHKQRRERFNKQREIPSGSSQTPTPKNNQSTNEETQQKLITTQDLMTFDKELNKQRKCDINANVDNKNDWVDIDMGNSVEFERLLQATYSQAPFEVKHIKFAGDSQTNSSNSTLSTISNAHSHCTENGVLPAECKADVSKMTAMPSSSLKAATSAEGSAHLSRTIYGGSVIFNRRIPNVSSTYVRKSSIYVKNTDATTMGANDIILVTDQTITIADLLRMWRQMNITARLIICLLTMASLSSLFILMPISFYSSKE